MVATASIMLPLGTLAPRFTLQDSLSKQWVPLERLRGKRATVIMFICNHCPYVKHVQSELVRLAHDYQAKAVGFIAINSNDAVAYPEDAPDKMAKVAEEWGYPFPYLYDEDQSVAKAYQAACTPDFYIFDQDLRCVYRGQLDDARPGNAITPNGQSIRQALNQLLAQQPVSTNQKTSIGCNIKWKSTVYTS